MRAMDASASPSPTTRPQAGRFFDLEKGELEETVRAAGMPRFRADQLLHWVYRRGVTDPHTMTNISKADRAKAAEMLSFARGRVAEHEIATDGTQKLLLELVADDATRRTTECVMIPDREVGGGQRRTACVSSQVGCPVGCRFCASGLGGLEKNLTAGEIVEQVHWLNQLPETGPINHVVFMGMGEPLANFREVTRAIRILTAEWGYNISGRKITLSTVGLPSQIRRLADLGVPVTLALSLHAPDDAIRRELIPWASSTSIDRLVDAGRAYFEKTGREITVEYTLLHGVNDRPEHAAELARITKQLRANVNLIRYNEVEGLPFDRPATDAVHRFQEILRDRGVNVHIRASRGRDIAAACGQLKHETSS